MKIKSNLKALFIAGLFALPMMVSSAQAQDNNNKQTIKPLAYEVAMQVSSSQDFLNNLAKGTQAMVQKVREVFPALTPEAAEAFANNYLNLVIEKLSPVHAEIQAKIFSELFTDEELVKLKDMTSTPEGADIMLKFTTAMRVQGVVIARETVKEQQEVFDAAVKRTIEQGHKLSYAQKK